MQQTDRSDGVFHEERTACVPRPTALLGPPVERSEEMGLNGRAEGLLDGRNG